MRIKIKSTTCLIILTLFISCKKNNSQIESTKDSMVKTSVTKHSSWNLIDSTYYFYNENNRIIKEWLVVRADTALVSFLEIAYEYKGIDSLIVTNLSNRYKLNLNGLIQNDINAYLSWHYSYDQNLFPKIISFAYNVYPFTQTRDSFIVENQNIKKQYQFRDNIFSNGTVVNQYEFYVSENTLKNTNIGKSFLGNSNKNLIKSMSINSRVTSKSTGIVGNSASTFFYTYEFDNMNRVIKKEQTSNTNNDTTKTYIEYY